jgi:hypothetical protein
MIWDRSLATNAKRLALCTLLALLSVGLLAAANTSRAADTEVLPIDLAWRVEIVDERGYYSAMVLDGNGFPHIAYEATAPESAYDLKYAQWTGSQWALQRVADMAWGGATAIALKSVTSTNGISVYPHISYSACNMFYCPPRYAEWTGSEWVITTTVDGNGSLAIDANGDPHLSYSYGNVIGSISQKYAHRIGSDWNAITIENNLPDRTYSSLKLDSNGYPHISYYNGYLAYAWWSGSSWISQGVEKTYYAGQYTSLALDAHDRPHISYYDWDKGDLRYAVWTGSQWSLQTVDSAGDVGTYTSLALDSKGYPHIAYHDVTSATLKYARWTGANWRIDVVDTDVSDYTGISLALDANDQPRIAYTHRAGLKFAWGEPPKLIYLPVIIQGS